MSGYLRMRIPLFTYFIILKKNHLLVIAYGILIQLVKGIQLTFPNDSIKPIIRIPVNNNRKLDVEKRKK